MLPRSGRRGLTPMLMSFMMASRISKRMPEYPWRKVLMRTSMDARVTSDGSEWQSVPMPKMPAFKCLEGGAELASNLITSLFVLILIIT
jgi:hypothetical protein